jgi:hypothetical protein
MMPAFLVIGGQRCGTSSLYRYLGWHPDVLPPLRKETEYFSREYARGRGWYQAHFPLEARQAFRERGAARRVVTFEATPDYLFYPPAPERAAHLLPDAKLLVLLRDPVDRAVSHYRHMVRLGFEHLSFEDALRAERDRMRDDLEAVERDSSYRPRDLLRFSYVSRGMYAEQLERWMRFFPEDRFLIVGSEGFFDRTGAVYAEILRFLGLREAVPDAFPNASLSSALSEHPDVKEETLASLREFFGPRNAQLSELLGRDLGWNE